jgi:hypothetical protein
MLTALAVLLLSAVGGGVVGAYLTTLYPADTICSTCQEKAQNQQIEIWQDSQEHNHFNQDQEENLPELNQDWEENPE